MVIPVFNEAENLGVLYARLTKVMHSLDGSHEIIFVDDGSTDDSFNILEALCGQDNHVRAIQLTRNFGQHPAVMAGLDSAQGEVIVTIDADLQNPPEEIPKLLNKLDEGYEVVFGILTHRKHSFLRNAGSAFTKKVLAEILPTGMTNLSAFRALRSYVAENLKLFSERSKFLDGLICWMGYKIGTVDVQHQKRFAGKTKYNLFKLIRLWFDLVVSLTDIPLKFATYAGAGLGSISLLLALFYVIRYFITGFSVPGFATTVILITVFAGIQLFCLGILGEYIGRMNVEVKRKPDYIIRDKRSK